VASVSFVVKPPRASRRIEYRCAEYEYHFVEYEYEYDHLPISYISPAFCILYFSINHQSLLITQSSAFRFVPSVSFVVKPPRASPRLEHACPVP
jgi:hypothetical protein